MAKLISSLFIFTLLVVGFATGASAADTKNCGDFNGDANAIAKFWVDNGYSASNDPHNLDGDSDGLPCEADQAAIDKYVAQRDAEAATSEEENDDTAASTNDDSDVSTQVEESSASDSKNNDSSSSANSKDESVSTVKESDEKVVQQGEALPKTATNSGMLMLISGGLLAAGLITLAVKKTQKV